MKVFFSILSALLFANAVQAEVVFSPSKDASANVEQIRVKFPESMKKVDKPFSVTCDPVIKGFGSWADNNTTWIYNLELEKDRWGDVHPMAGGTGCKLVQGVELETASGRSYSKGLLKHEFVVSGPNVTAVFPMPGFDGKLRETQPVFMVVFDGDIKRDTFYASGGSFLWYPIKDGYPSEKILLTAVPSEKSSTVFSTFAKEYGLEYRNVKEDSKNWALVTVDRSLIPGAELNLSISGVKSAYASGALVAEKDEKIKVRESFRAEVNCSRVAVGSPNCMPEGGLSVVLNSSVKWADAKKAYVEYVPQNSKDGKVVQAYPSTEGVVSNWLGYLASKLNISINDDARLRSLNFSGVKVAPQTTAKVVLPASLSDVDGRLIASSTYELSYGSYSEVISFPENLTIMERKVTGNSALPVAIMNLNQKIKVLKTGTALNSWEPVVSMPSIIDLIIGYDSVDRYDEETPYVSPLASLGIASTEEEVSLTGEENKRTFLSLPYGLDRKSGVYAVEIKSELSNRKDSAYNLTLLTDLNVHLKSGKEEATAWVTSYSTGLPVSNAKVDIYDCNKAVALSGKTDSNGIFKFSHKNVSQKCPEKRGSYLLSKDSYFVAASNSEDMAFTHSSYRADGAWATSAPGVDYIYSNISDDSVYIHSLVGINLVKPGQTVPVQLSAVLPNQQGFTAVSESVLPKVVKVRSNNSDISYEFPLTWKNGIAEFKWEVPSSAELGSYSLQIQQPGRSWFNNIGTDIEVSEFKVPLMTANVSLEKGPLVKPSELTVSGLIRFANGIGAKDQEIEEVAYFFVPASLNVKDYAGFDYVKGDFNDKADDSESGLPNREQVAQIKGLVTDSEGAIKVDLAKEALTSGESVADLLGTVKRPYNLVVRMKYKDQMGEFQTVSTSQKVYNTSSYVGSKVTKGELAKAALEVISMGVDGKPYTNMTDLDVKVLEIKTHVIGEEVFGGFVKNTFESELVKTDWTPSCNLEKGVAKCSAKGLAQGNYILSVASKSNGQKTYSKFKVDGEGVLTGENDYFYFDEEVKGVLLAANKESYKGGDVAKLTFESPFETCSALVTLERSEVVESYVDNKACENGFVKLKVTAENAPNIFASVYFVTGRSNNDVTFESLDLGKPTYRLGFSNLKVDWEKYALDVEVNLDKEEYKPGEIAVANVDVRAQLGNLTDASVTFFAVEERILALKNNDSMKVLEFLMGMRDHSVSTVNTYEYLNSVAEVEAVLAEPVVESGLRKGGEEGGSGSEQESFQRKLFDALVAWETNVPVVNGLAQVKFKLNDKLTKFKVFAVVSDASRKYGTGESAYLASQEVQTYSNIPSVARTGDEFPATVTVQNNGKQTGNYTVVIDYTVRNADGTVTPKSVTQKVAVDKGGSKAVSLGDVKIPEGTSTVDYAITVYNENGVKVDALAPPTQKVSPAIPLTVQDEFLVQMDQDSQEFTLIKNKKALPKQGVIDTKVFSSLVKTAEYSIKKSVSEDVFADVTVEGKLIKALLESDVDNQSAMAKAYAELVSQVDSNGFIKYYSGASRGNFWMTVELVQLISMKPWALDIMPKSLKEKLSASLVQVIQGKADPKYIAPASNVIAWTSARVKAANTLVYVDKAQGLAYSKPVLDLVNKAGEFKQYSVGTLADVALLTSNVDPGSLMTSVLMKYVQEAVLSVKNTSAILKGDASFGWWGYSDEVVATSKLVKAQSAAARVTEAASSENYLDNLVVGLIQANKAGKWYTNRTKAWVLNGLTSFANTYESVAVSGRTSVSSTETSIAANISWNTPKESNGISSAWANSDAKISVDHKGAGKPWVSVVAQSAVKLDAPNYQGLKVVKVVTNKSNAGDVYTAGDLIQVDITIENPSSLSHVALFDPIPSGANILSDGWGSYSSAQKSYSGYKVYFNYLKAGAVTLSYQYQLNNPGSFELPQTRVEALYEPGLFGETPNVKMTVVK